MSKVEYKKQYMGSSKESLQWIIFEKLFDKIWGYEMRTLPHYPTVIGGVYAHWLDKNEVKYEAESLGEIQQAFNNEEISTFEIISYPGQKPYAHLLYVNKDNSVFFEFSSDKQEETNSAISLINNHFPNQREKTTITPLDNYIHISRINELKQTKNKNFDLTKLIRLCEELNIVFSEKCYFSTIMIVRSIIDHIPPIFGEMDFNKVISNYGNKSFKESMKNLNKSSRKIADSYLHQQIRTKEILPNSNQVRFIQDLDVLLSEIVRVLKE